MSATQSNFCSRSPELRPSGFTLAEVLITLVIIGVIAAITVPTMMNNKRNEELRAGLLKAQSTLAGALEMYYAKNGVRLLPQDCYTRGSLKDKLMPYISTIKDCDLYNCITKQANNNRESDVYRNFNNTAGARTTYFDDGQFIMNDGMMVLIENPEGSDSIFISVDVNGYKKKPNKSGHDLFMFQLNNKGHFKPMGVQGTYYYSETNNYCSPTSTGTSNGFGCTAKALSDPDYFKHLH